MVSAIAGLLVLEAFIWSLTLLSGKFFYKYINTNKRQHPLLRILKIVLSLATITVCIWLFTNLVFGVAGANNVLVVLYIVLHIIWAGERVVSILVTLEKV